MNLLNIHLRIFLYKLLNFFESGFTLNIIKLFQSISEVLRKFYKTMCNDNLYREV